MLRLLSLSGLPSRFAARFARWREAGFVMIVASFALAPWCAFPIVTSAHAGVLLAIEDDGGIFEFDTDGPSVIQISTGLVGNVNATGFDPVNNRFYYGVDTGSRGGDLYVWEIDPDTHAFLGNVGTAGGPAAPILGNAAFHDGVYYFVQDNTDDLWAVTFSFAGVPTIDTVTKVADMTTNTRTFTFGDIAITEAGLLFGSANEEALFTYMLPGGPFVDLGASGTALQLGLDVTGALFGARFNSGEFFSLDTTTGARTSLGTTPTQFTDMASISRLWVRTRGLPAAVLGTSYAVSLEAVAHAHPLSWELATGALPDGLTLGTDGSITGTPTEVGAFPLRVRATDNAGTTAARTLTLEVLLTLPPADIRISKVGTRPVPGRSLDYFIHVENRGTTVLSNFSVSEFLEPWFSFLSASPAPASVEPLPDPFSVDPGAYDGLLLWDLPTLTPGDATVLSYRARLDPELPFGRTVTGGACLVDPGDVDCQRDALRSCMQGLVEGCREAAGGMGAVACTDIVKFGIISCLASYVGCEAVTLPFRGICAVTERLTAGPRDPNEKLVSLGPFVRSDQTLLYPIHFENIGQVEALDVFVTDVLSPHLDDSTLEILSPDGSYEPLTRTLRWELFGHNLQPGETGNVLFSIKPAPGLVSGTEIRNSAEIQFEVFAPLVTPDVVNIIDDIVPECTIGPLPAEVGTAVFPVSWSVADAVGEPETTKVLVATDGGAYELYTDTTGDGTALFVGEIGRQYEFLCFTKDTAGNAEAQDLVAEAVTTVSLSAPIADHQVIYKAKAAKREDLPDNGKFPKKDYNLLLDDLLLPNSEPDDPENYQVKKEKGLGVPAMKNAEPGPSAPERHYIRYQLKEAKEGAGDYDVNREKYPKAVKQIKRTWDVTNQFGTISVTTKKVEALLVPAGKDLLGAPAPPSDATHYICYQAKVTKDVSDQTPDSGNGQGKFRKDLQAFFGDQFLDVDCVADENGDPSFSGTSIAGKCLFDLKKVRALCNPISKNDVGGVPARITTAPTGSMSTPTTAESLLCYQVKLARKIVGEEAANLSGLSIGQKLRQSAHQARSPHTTPGNQFPSPLQMDTKKPEFACIPTTITGVAAVP